MPSSSESYFIYVEESQHSTIPQSFYLLESFYIKFHHFHSTSFNHYSFFIPCNILCDYDEFESLDPDSFTNTFLRDTLLSVPISPEVLEQTLLLIGDYARHMITMSIEGHRILEMDVFVNVMPNISDANVFDHQNAYLTTILNSLEKVKLDNIDMPSCSTEQCAICLEEFFDGSKSHIVRTKCMHVFHELCVAKWLQHCDITNLLYSCPLCRSQI
jgi:hypothetical protein